MSNMSVNQRNQTDQARLAGSNEGIRRGSERGALVYNAFALVVGAGLSFAALSAIEGWAQWIVLGVIVMTVIGFMIAISPKREGW